MKTKIYKLGLLAAMITSVYACKSADTEKVDLKTIIASADDAEYAKKIERETPIKLAEGVTISLWATDSLAPDPVSMSIDDYNNIYLTRTNRQKNSEFDIRGHRDWMTESISWKSVEDRRAFLRSFFDPKKSKDNEWLEDLNGDGSHDWKDLTIQKEELWKLEDTDGDGRADKSTLVLKDFNEEITDVAGAILVRKKDAFIGIGPDLWRIEDTNGDGYYDKKTSISHGWNVHVGFSGHGMSGLVEGPDGKIYWGIGDPGVNIIDKSGKKHFYPNEGVIARCNPDGSDFEIFSHGHRNTHEFVFDEYGNIISSDNDGDHPGESERLVHLVDGSDSGWRINWQFGKYTDPKNNQYKVWMDEGMSYPRHEGQAAYYLPPIRNYHNGPTGMQYNPGTALGKKWLNKFFLVEFPGTPTGAHIWAFDLKPKGASFDFKSEESMVNGILATGIRFGTDGALYAADWINGWGTKNYGRVWKLDVEDKEFEAIRLKTKNLMASEFEKKTDNELYDLLFFADQRVRQKAQFEIVNRNAASNLFIKASQQNKNQLARIHAIWGMGQLINQKKGDSKQLISLLKDSDGEIVAQALKVLGDTKSVEAGSVMIPYLSSTNPRVQFFAAQALGRVGHKAAVQPLINLLIKNNNQDLYIRHAAVMALSRIEDKPSVYNMLNHSESSVRLASVLVLRKWKDSEVSKALNDKDEYIVAEAARAINDDFSIEGALPALAKLLTKPEVSSEVIMRRAINAALRVGGDANLDLLLSYSKNAKVSPKLRAEALATLSVWASPSVLDRVDGTFRGEIRRDPAKVKSKISKELHAFLESTDPEMLISTFAVITSYKLTEFNDKIQGLYKTSKANNVKTSALNALAELNFKGIAPLITEALKSDDNGLRGTALGMLSKLDISAEDLPQMVNNILKSGTKGDKQRMLKSLGEMPLVKTEKVFASLIDKLKSGELPIEIRLDLSDAVNATTSEKLKLALRQSLPKGNIMDEYSDVLEGGNGWKGREYFTKNETGQCIRCHTLDGSSGGVGPDLGKIGSVLDRRQLLQALIEPSSRLAPGFGTVVLKLKDGQEIIGILEKETSKELVIRTSEAEPLRVPIVRIANRENLPSAMPVQTEKMTKHEIRDVIEFLANQK